MCAETGTSSGGSGAFGLTARPGIGRVSVAIRILPVAAGAIARLASCLVHGDTLCLGRHFVSFTFCKVLLFQVLGSQVRGRQQSMASGRVENRDIAPGPSPQVTWSYVREPFAGTPAPSKNDEHLEP